MRTYDLNQYAVELRKQGLTFKKIGEKLGVSLERARGRVVMGTRQTKGFERGKNATTMGDLFMSYKPMYAIKHLGAENMTFTEFLENISQQTLVETIHIGKAAVKEILYELRKKNVPEKIIQNWENVEFVKIKKPKKKDVTQAYQMDPKKSTIPVRDMS
jgi:hypothetical protein|tara:strand:- start:277 stop:753 length:477 start_codon:yes stop_codon:yes gene_type:complete